MLDAHRQQFPALTHHTYFNFGGQGPLPTPALSAIHQAFTRLDQTGPFSNTAHTWFAQECSQLRSAIAAELNIAPATLTLTENVTVGCNIPLWGINWQPGDHLLISDCEHPGVVAAVQELQRRFAIEISVCPLQATLNDGDPVACIATHLRPRTRLVVISHLLWNTGQVLPLAEIVQICHAYEAAASPVRVLVDGAQSVGCLPLDLTAIAVDFYAFTGHKWWCGPAGVGGLYVHPDALESVQPTFIGWRGITTDPVGTPTGWQPGSKRYEVATAAVPLYAGLSAAIALHQQWGTATERYQEICQLSQTLWQQLSQFPFIRCLRTTPPGGRSGQLPMAPRPHPCRSSKT
ncbi:aminotransferase class V-fold PLP-dependent enzyme [Neosynechococcus sphagnicola]|uniref:aminotransferase class V-fold PLP-dependent enzyme n=1 Tax=Neosynechococcus sphagnicola TaxID=1501145 RepID=UPI000B1C5F19|nr:aminotransferase class V-fold PLP-dependent enzyme [Neosynechococcus sphagnicola]